MQKNDSVVDEILRTGFVNISFASLSKLVIANDKIAETVFSFSDDEFQFLNDGGTFNIVEVVSKKHGEIITPIKLSAKSTVPLNQFDRAVLSALMSHHISGQSLLTLNIVYRALCGKFKKLNTTADPTEAQREAIRLSIDKMRLTDFTANLSNLTEHLNYNDHKPITFSANLLSCRHVSGIKINGNFSETLIFIDALSPIYSIAQLKNQVLTCDVAVLDVPKQHNSVETIGVKHYVLQRVLEIIAHKMNPTITFADVFEKCGLNGVNRKQKSRTRQYIQSFLSHLQNCGVIKSFVVEKIDGASQAVKITGYKKTRNQDAPLNCPKCSPKLSKMLP